MKSHSLSSSFFSENRKNFIRRMQPGSVAFILSNDEQPRSSDQVFPFRQNPDFFYLTGIDQEKSFLMLFPDSPNPALREVLFVLETNEHIAVWDGAKYSKPQATEVSGIARVEWLAGIEPAIKEAMMYAQYVYLGTMENNRYPGEANYRSLRFAHDLRNRYPLHNYQRATPILTTLRLIKSPQELEVLQKAIGITANAFKRVLQMVKPGVGEYEIEAEIIHEYIRSKATGHSFHPIVASGADACILHYIANNKICRDGDLLLLDTGAEYSNYAGDLSRTIPINGRFSPRQKQVYNACLRVMRSATQLLVPGSCLDSYQKEVMPVMADELAGLGLIAVRDSQNEEAVLSAAKKYFPHSTSHFLGLDVHDEGHKFEVFKPGMVLTCEPGIYIPEEGIGVRIENNILITEDKPRDLTAFIAIETDEIEDLMLGAR